MNDAEDYADSMQRQFERYWKRVDNNEVIEEEDKLNPLEITQETGMSFDILFTTGGPGAYVTSQAGDHAVLIVVWGSKVAKKQSEEITRVAKYFWEKK